MTEIRFLTNEAAKTEGLAYAGFETFRGSPYASCAREMGQNSRDASAGNGPVHVLFRLHLLKISEIPFANQLLHSIGCCLQSPQDEKTRQHLERARKTLENQRLRVLEISDTNTTGLIGPIDDELSVFNALVKGDGVTNKRDETSAGSFGIGKNATYAVSDLQTVAYSTLYKDLNGTSTKFAAQGRLRLISHRDGEKKYSAEGYWGDKDFKAIEDPSLVPAWMRRETIGTSIFAIGFREEDQWEWRMILSLVSNFFLAIYRGEIEFSVSEKTKITQSSLDSLLGSEELRKAAINCDREAELDRAIRLMQCIRSDARTQHTISIHGLGDFTLHLLVAENLPREIHVLRNGIYITDNFSKFSQPLRYFPGTREFSAILEPAQNVNGRHPSSLLKRIENPAHDSFEPERIVDELQRDIAKRQIKELVRSAREIIRKNAKIDDVQRSQLDELSSLFSNPHEQGGGKKNEADPDRFRYGKAEVQQRRKPPGTNAGDGGRKKGNADELTPGQRSGRSQKTRQEPRSSPAIPLEDIRSVIPREGSAHQRMIHFTCSIDVMLEISIYASGLSEDIELNVVSASVEIGESGRPRVNAIANERVSLLVDFGEKFQGPIEIVATKVDKQ